MRTKSADVPQTAPEFRNLLSKGFLQIPVYDVLPTTWDGSGIIAVRTGAQFTPVYTYYWWDGDSFVALFPEPVIPTLASGVYTPSITGVTNITAVTTYEAQYLRVGNTVTVSGKVDVDPTTDIGAPNTRLGISLPVASNLGAEEDCAGAASASGATAGLASEGAAIKGDSANNRAEMQWATTNAANHAMFYTFTYQVI